MRRLAFASSLALAPLVLACSSNDDPASASPALATAPTARVAGARLDVVAPDGRVLLEGLPPADVADGAPPLVGFATRAATTSYEMKFGAFKPTEQASAPWRVGRSIVAGASGSYDVLDDAGAALAHLAFTSPDEGHLAVHVTPAGSELRFSWGFACAPSDHFSGFGAQTWDVDHRGQTVPTWVQEEGIGKIAADTYDDPTWYVVGRRHSSQAPIPEFLARRGYVLAAETDVEATFALCSERADAARLELELPVTVHLFDGPSPAEALERATRTLGRPRLPPLVAFAPWNDAIFGSANVRAVAKKLRDEGVPSSALWTEDWRGADWQGESYRLKEDWDVDPTLYPDMRALADDLHAEGFDFFVYFNPFVYQGSTAWNETQPNGWLIQHEDGSDYTFMGAKFTPTGLIDPWNPGGRAWIVKKLQGAIALGADGWMADFAEWLPTDGKSYAGPTRTLHNRYPVAWQEANREAIDGVVDGEERLMFVRSGWFGTPALADVFWAGDQRSDLQVDDGMPTIVPIGVGLGIAGVSTYGHDIAGYQSASNPPADKETFFRWTELGALSPVMRTHHGTAPRLAWHWDSDAETIAHFRRYARLHISLVPLLDGLSWEAAMVDGLPIWRGLMLRWPDDERAWSITDEVMLGDALLVAPVQTPGATSREVYLPAGRWFPWSGGDAVDGPATITVQAPLGEIPLFARAGAVVPMFPDGVMTLAHGSAAVPDPASLGGARVVQLFLGGAGSARDGRGAGAPALSLAHLADGSGAATYAWNDVTLAACDASATAPCAELAAGGDTLHLRGAGKLAVTRGGAVTDAADLAVTVTDAPLTVVVRR